MKLEHNYWSKGMKLEQQVRTTTTDQQGMKLEQKGNDQQGMKLEQQLLINREWS